MPSPSLASALPVYLAVSLHLSPTGTRLAWPRPPATLADLVKEAKANENAFRARVRTVLRSSYSTHYRRMLPRLLAALEFRSNNVAHRPIVDALGLLARWPNGTTTSPRSASPSTQQRS